MGKKDALAVIGETGLSLGEGSKKGKKRKNKMVVGEKGLFVDEVTDIGYEVGGILGLQKFYYNGMLESIDRSCTDKAGKVDIEKANAAKKDVLFKHLLGSVVARRMVRRSTVLGAAARAVTAIAAVHLGSVL